MEMHLHFLLSCSISTPPPSFPLAPLSSSPTQPSTVNSLPLDWALPLLATLSDGTHVVLTVVHGKADATVGPDGTVTTGE